MVKVLLQTIRASRHVIVPVEAHYLGLNGLRQMAQTIATVQQHNPRLEISMVIPCRAHPRRRVHNEILGRLQEMFPGRVAPMVRENVAVAEAPAHGMPVTLYAPKSNGAQDYRKVVRWFREQLQV